MATVELTNIGRVESLKLPVPETGGVVVLTGPQGSGKSTALEATEALLVKGRGNVQARDGAANGTVSGFGVTLKVGRTSRRSGELEVACLEGRFDVSDLVEPGLKDPIAADVRRVKALVQLAGAEADPTLFAELLAEDQASADTFKSGDLVEMAARVKRDLEKAAREVEGKAERAESSARAARENAGDLDGPDDATELQTALETAVREETRLRTEYEAYKSQLDKAGEAERQLEESEARYKGPTVEAARGAVEAMTTVATAARQHVEDLRAQLQKAESEAIDLENKVNSATLELKAAEQHESTMAAWRASIDAVESVVMPSTEPIEVAAASVKAAREAVEIGALIRQAKAQRDEAAKLAKQARELRTEAESLRSRANRTDDVLSDVVAKLGCPLKVYQGRLVIETDRGPHTPYAELSMGEKYKPALDIAINAVGKRGVIVLKQEAWEGLDVWTRRGIVEQLDGSGVVLVTAEASRDESETELSAKVLS
jgi:energy-coupling factor transporter ATP-binding protein EcfA2